MEWLDNNPQSLTQKHERLLLYALVRALDPRRVLEIGFWAGGTTWTMAEALSENGADWRLVALSRDATWDRAGEFVVDFKQYGGKVDLVSGDSQNAEVVAAAVAKLAGRIDFVFHDGTHGRDTLFADLQNVLPHLAIEARVLIHDANHQPVSDGVQAFCAAHPGQIIDCGNVSPYQSNHIWGGLHLLRVRY